MIVFTPFFLLVCLALICRQFFFISTAKPSPCHYHTIAVRSLFQVDSATPSSSLANAAIFLQALFSCFFPVPSSIFPSHLSSCSVRFYFFCWEVWMRSVTLFRNVERDSSNIANISVHCCADLSIILVIQLWMEESTTFVYLALASNEQPSPKNLVPTIVAFSFIHINLKPPLVRSPVQSFFLPCDATVAPEAIHQSSCKRGQWLCFCNSQSCCADLFIILVIQVRLKEFTTFAHLSHA